jgi:tetratricopeptide (TPR) repeat protein
LGQHYAADLTQQDKALFHFQSFLKKQPKEQNLIASAYSTMSEIYYSKHEFNNALHPAKKSLSIAPKQSIGYLLLSKIEVELGQFQTAISHLEKLIKNYKNNQNFSSDNALDCVLNSNQIEGFIIKILFFHLNRDESVKRMNNIWKNANDFGDINQLFYEWKDEEKDTLLQWIKKNRSSNTTPKESLEILGFLYLMKNEYIKALPIFQNVFDQGNRSPLNIKSLAGIYAKMGQIEKAGDLLKCLS